MKWILFIVVCFISCNTIQKETGLIKSHTEAYVYLIKIPYHTLEYDIFDGGHLHIHKPKKGKVLLQFEISGTLNRAVLWSSENGSFDNLEACYEERECNFNTIDGSTIDVTNLTGKYLIHYNSCNIGGAYILTLD